MLRPLTPLLLIVMTIPAPAQVSVTGRGDAAQYGQALGELERGKTAQAIATLTTLINNIAATEPIRHAAGVVLEQLNGDAAKRLEPFHRKAHGEAVMLVPDERALLAAVEQWTDELIWPVLIADAWFAPIFIEAYQPKQVVYWPGPRAKDEPKVAQRLAKRVEEHNAQVAKRIADGFRPPGLVAIDPDDPQRCAGVALAIAYGQPIELIDEGSAPRYKAADPDRAKELVARFHRALVDRKIAAKGSWCGLTLAGRYPYRYRTEPKANPVLSLDDLLGRGPSGLRAAVCGRLSGDVTQSTYQAMASMFLDPRRALLADDYANRPGAFGHYTLGEAEAALGDRFDVTRLTGEGLTPTAFRVAAGSLPSPAFVWVNSSGNANFMDLRGRATPSDVPVGGAQAAYVVHSFSAQNIESVDTIGGRWLAGGAYWYFGSTHEPYLMAFVRSVGLATKALAGTPVAMATKHSPGTPMARPWKTMVVGNPLWAWRDKPAKRRAVDAIPAARPITPPDPGDAVGGLVHVRLTGGKVTGPMLESAFNSLADATPDQVARVVHEAAAAKRSDLIGAADPGVLSQHPLAEYYGGDDVLADFTRALRTNDLAGATRQLPRLIRLAGHRKPVGKAVDDWLKKMDQSGNGDQARKLLSALSQDKKLPRPTRQMLTGLIEATAKKPRK